MWEKRSKQTFAFATVLSALLMMQMILYAYQMVCQGTFGFSMYGACHSFLKQAGLSAVAIMLDVLILFTLMSLFYHLGKQVLLYKRFSHKLELIKDHDESSRLEERFGMKVSVIPSPDPAAFTAGFLKPVIVLSSGLLQLLNEKELEAVIYHEQFHQLQKDPLKKCILQFIAGTLWYIPIFKWWKKHYELSKEVLADRWAIQATGGIADLSHALLKMMKHGKKQRSSFTVSINQTAINYRIMHLLDPETSEPVKTPRSVVIASVQVVLVIAGMFIISP
ncbi:M56 family peptidase [Bacillus sp. FJAT-42376]|uniref:M56 family metallopeptidase n=1 Tax=Bacillus sp. FJAT-42376 TaxID=2014076 RepID=UPI000F4E0723|nr:M56 family metallopeptidase [Bacillus sp. FJAT-42376]AZB41604.1 M56 family peptidase [Bacillus sp. FJAT-42376]